MSNGRTTKIYEPVTNGCEDLDFITTLQQPQEIVLRNISEGDILSVEVSPSSRVEVLNYKGELCGIIASPQLEQLVQCIGQGYKYQAEVRGIRELTCIVKVQLA